MSEKLFRHVVLLRFKQGTSREEVRRIETAFAALKGKIGLIRDFEWGTDSSVENLAQGFSHCFLVSFATAKDRDAYLPHPAHQEFVALLEPYRENVLVLDYQPQG